MTFKCTSKLHFLIFMALLTAIALTIFIIEAQIPVPVAIPGIKLGLSNIITLIMIAKFRKREVLIVLLLRIGLGSFFSGQIISMLYSLAGGILAFLSMCAIYHLLKKSNLWFVGVVGAVFHNIGQIGMAMLLLQTVYAGYYFVILLFCGIITGLFTGIVSDQLSRRITVIRS